MPKRKKPTVTTEEYLRANYPEPLPRWLREHRPGDDKPTFGTLLSSRVVYYPGSGTDGEPVRIFNQSRSAHVFLYVDWMFTRRKLNAALRRRYFSGYHRLDRFEYPGSEIAPIHFAPEARITRESAETSREIISRTKPFCRVEVMERDADRDDDFGAEKLAVVFLCADGFTAYDALFGGRKYPAPFAAVLHDYGFGGNYDSFGAGGLLEKFAAGSGAFPELLLVENGTEPWRGYSRIEGVKHAIAGGTYYWYHYLYRRY